MTDVLSTANGQSLAGSRSSWGRMARTIATSTLSITAIVVSLLLMLAASLLAEPRGNRGGASGDVSGTVTDSATGQPISSAEISVTRGGSIIINRLSDAFGRYTVHNLSAGTYVITARYIGFRAKSRQLTIAAGAGDRTGVDFQLSASSVTLETVQVSAAAPVAVDTRTGDQIFAETEVHLAPTLTTSQVLQTSIAGAAKAPTGEVHIRGQHAEYTYYIDGVPVPSGISGSLNELFDPQVAEKISFETGGWDAEYGNKNAAIVNVATKIPSGGFHSNLGSYYGQYVSNGLTGGKNFDGQSMTMSTNAGRWGFFISGARQFSDMRREPVAYDSVGRKAINFHNNGFDYFSFGKIQYTPGVNDVFSLDANISQTLFQVPYDSSGNTFLDDNQRDQNSFVNLGWHHLFGGEAAGGASNVPELFGAVFYRHGSLLYTPSPQDSAQFVFYPDTATAYNLTERRRFDSYGVKLDYSIHPQNELEFKIGTQSSVTTGHEDFSTISSTGQAGPASNSGLSGSDVGVYAQTAYSPVEQFEIRTGVRYDAHRAPFAGTQSQVSPRIRLNFYPATGTTLYAYYGRLFVPTNVEDLRAITSVAQGGVVAQPTLPERDHFFELGLVTHLLPSLSTKLSAYRKISDPGIDDNTVPGSAIVTSVNIEHVRITGLEGVLEWSPQGPFSGYVNAALNHAYGYGAITGGFFPTAPPKGSFDLDHDQRLSVVASGTYTLNRFYVSATETYGSGLTNGVDPASCNCSYGTGLFDFNSGIKVKPNYVTDASTGYSLSAAGRVLQMQLYVQNVFDKQYVLKGAFFSGPSIGRPRSIQLRLNLGI